MTKNQVASFIAHGDVSLFADHHNIDHDAIDELATRFMALPQETRQLALSYGLSDLMFIESLRLLK